MGTASVLLYLVPLVPHSLAGIHFWLKSKGKCLALAINQESAYTYVGISQIARILAYTNSASHFFLHYYAKIWLLFNLLCWERMKLEMFRF